MASVVYSVDFVVDYFHIVICCLLVVVFFLPVFLSFDQPIRNLFILCVRVYFFISKATGNSYQTKQ